MTHDIEFALILFVAVFGWSTCTAVDNHRDIEMRKLDLQEKRMQAERKP